MPFSSIDLLQFPQLCELIATYAGSASGKECILALEPYSNVDAIRADLAEAGEGIEYLGSSNSSIGSPLKLRFDTIPDLDSSLPLIKVEGARLDGRQILDLFRLLEIAAEYRAALRACASRFPLLSRYGESLADLEFIATRWRGAFLPNGHLLDSASVALGRIRRDIERQKRSIQDSLDRFLRTHRTDGTLQEDFVTVREDRYVVPVIAGQKNRVDGVIHGASGTGRTLYLEPLETIGLNNQLVRLRDDEIREIERILGEITSSFREHQQAIVETVEALTHLDIIFAKADFAQHYNAVIPAISTDRRGFVLRNARHPLLETVLRRSRRTIVPISFELDEDQRCLLISGPNTGGKTVTMKTAGLLALMAHAAFPVPCEEAMFPLFDDVLADVGDSQSIEESLSSFSGHLLHVKDLLERVTANSLVLLDELGRATDPDEGGALGVAILEEFRISGCFCLASTHLLPLKLYGSRTANVLNASMGFDEVTLAPTYQLRLGLPGKSAGLDIASKLNMPAKVLEHARTVLPRLQTDFSELLQDLHRQKEEIEAQTAALTSEREALRARTGILESAALKREDQRQREWTRKFEELIADFEARALLTISQVTEAAEGRKAVEQAKRQLSQARREFAEEAAVVMAPPPEFARAAPARPVIREGVRVKLRDVRETATVRRILKNGSVEVEAGLLRMQIPPEDVLEIVADANTSSTKLPANVRVETGPRWDVSYRELNLIGQRAEHAVDEVDRFLDSAVLASVDRVRIIHGHGMGVLKRAVAEHLRSNPHVGTFYAASPAEGGTGATIVELRN